MKLRRNRNSRQARKMITRQTVDALDALALIMWLAVGAAALWVVVFNGALR